jgi:protein-S-isoprenylcysteine O-methyltransferase Ste14
MLRARSGEADSRRVKAGTITFFGWFQLLALMAFLILIVGRTMHLLIHRKVNPITLGLAGKGKTGLMEVLLFAGVNLWAVVVVFCALSLEGPPFVWTCGVRLVDGPPAKWLGVAMVLCAFVLLVLALRALGNSWRLGIDEHHPGRLVTAGIYAYSRNPIYLFFDLYFLGTFLINGGLFFLLMAVLGALNLHYQILREEQFLADTHGAVYEAYCDRTARYMAWANLGRSRRQLG